MNTKILNYRVIVYPDIQTGARKQIYTALCPTLGVADSGDTIDEALNNIKGAIQVYIDSLIEDKEIAPTEKTEQDVITSVQIKIPALMRI